MQFSSAFFFTFSLLSSVVRALSLTFSAYFLSPALRYQFHIYSKQTDKFIFGPMYILIFYIINGNTKVSEPIGIIPIIQSVLNFFVNIILDF
jgi:membrane protein DedA with SNARE-associated domain